MGVLKRNLWLAPLGLALAVMALSGTRASALVGDESGTASDRAGTLVIFPKVIADGTRDTLITMTNTSNTERYAHCMYVNGAGECSVSGELCVPTPVGGFGCPIAGEICQPRWIETDFGITLTAQQPTVWRVSTGRVVNPADGSDGDCEETLEEDTLRQGCPGIDPGNIIPPNQPFRGELKCYETDSSGDPWPGNALKGEATIETLPSGDISRYNSINFEASAEFGTNATVLDLNNSGLNVCPDVIEFTHYAHLASDVVAQALTPAACGSGDGICSGGANPGDNCDLPPDGDCVGGTCVGCPVRTEITFVPCTQNFEHQVPIPTTVQIRAIDQLEFPISASFTLDCWANLSLDQINLGTFATFVRGEFLKTRIFARATGRRCLDGSIFDDPNANPLLSCDVDADCGDGGVCGPQPGVLAIMEEIHEGPSSAARFDDGHAAVSPHMIGQRTGLCRGDLNTSCVDDSECSQGLCRGDGSQCAADGDCPTSQAVPNNRCDFCLIDEITIPEFIPPGP